MKKNRSHNRSLASGFVKAKEEIPKRMVVTNITHTFEPEDDDGVPLFNETFKILWYAPEALTEKQLTGLKMIYENFEIDTVYTVPCHPSAIKDRIENADIIAVGITHDQHIEDVLLPFVNANPDKDPDRAFIYTYIDNIRAHGCWLRFFPTHLSNCLFPKKLVSYFQIKVWDDLTKHIEINYEWAHFIPQDSFAPACIAMMIREDNGRKRRLYRYRFIEEHEFPEEYAPLLTYWVNCDSNGLHDEDEKIVEDVYNSDNPYKYVLGYRYVDLINGFDDLYTDLRGYFEPIYIDTFYPELGDMELL